MKVYICSIVIASASLIGCNSSSDASTSGSDAPAETKTPRNADVVISDSYEVESMPDGNFTNYYPNKQLKVSGMVSSGVRVGQWVSYHANGNKQSVNEYENGILHGKTVSYYESGQIMYIGYYKGGNYEGDWLYYNKDGVHLKTVVYKAGKIVTSKIVNDSII